jgi:hypothetical protein
MLAIECDYDVNGGLNFFDDFSCATINLWKNQVEVVRGPEFAQCEKSRILWLGAAGQYVGSCGKDLL